MSTSSVRFLLNHEEVLLDNVDPNLTVLQYLRDIRCQSGTKEGCASGDCGACTVVIAELSPESGSAKNNSALTYKSINSCITFVGSLHGKQLITVENLKQGNKLHHVQQAFVDQHGSQCGFCTPGFVMSAFALHKENDRPDREQVVEALAGNLCRCTGYKSIIDAAMSSSKDAEQDSFAQQYQQTIAQLTELNKLPAAVLNNGHHYYYAPESTRELSQYLREHTDATLVAGGTDLALGVTQNLRAIERMVYLGNVKELNVIEETEQHFTIGSAVPYTQFTPLLANEYPELGAMIERIGAKQVRNNGTLGGNIGNASPIGDMPPALIALGAKMTLQRDQQERSIAVEDYFTGYKQTVLATGEFIKTVDIPKALPNQFLKLYKISKRIDDDISAVLAAIFIELDDNVISQVRIAFGGMAAIPARAKNSEKTLLGKVLNQENIDAAMQALSTDFQPMSDVRASDKYRMTVAQNLLQKCYLELQNRNLLTRVTHYA
ncbi:xanthine dehydrogenase small subunit [Colwelliaceae bacterium 6471]